MNNNLKNLVAHYCLLQEAAYMLVFVGGRWSTELSSAVGSPAGFTVNCADECMHIDILANTNLAKPLHLLFLADEQNSPQIAHKNLITVGENSKIAIIEEHVVGALHNVVTQIKGGESTQINYCKIYSDNVIKKPLGSAIFTVNAELQLVLDEKSLVITNHLILGEAHHNIQEKISAVLTAPHVSCVNKGLYVLGGNLNDSAPQQQQQELNLEVNIEHVAPNCVSKELFKGVIADNARAIFAGKITVREGAQHTTARLDNKNLLLHENARVTTSPALEIYADDVQCSHGATVGQLDENALWYLQSRGIDEVAARNMLVQAFMQEIINDLPDCLREKIAQKHASLILG